MQKDNIIDNFEFERHFRERGIYSQRRYPNEAFIQFLAAHYFRFSRARRRRVKMLELGCGSGANLWMAAREGFAAYGIDISPTGIALCKDVFKDWNVRATLAVANMYDLPFSRSFFNVIFDVVSVQHTNIAGHKKVYEEAFRCLKKGGRFFQWHLEASSDFFQQNTDFIDRFTARDFLGNGRTCFLTASFARQLLTAVGFHDINIEKVTRTYENMKTAMSYLAISAQK